MMCRGRVSVVAGLPSSIDQHGGVLGVMDVAFVGPKLYALLDAGCGHGVPDVRAGVARIENAGFTMVADLTTFVQENPVANPSLEDFEPDGDWYSMVARGGVLYAVDANGGQVVTVQPDTGRVERVVDISATQGHIVPTAIAAGNGRFFVGNLTPFPSVPGSARILELKRSGSFTEYATGFTPILGIETDKHDNLYVLETFACLPQLPCVPAPFAQGTGQIVRVGRDGSRTVIATGLTFPTSMRFGPDGALYVSNKGYNLPPGSGEMLRIAID